MKSEKSNINEVSRFIWDLLKNFQFTIPLLLICTIIFSSSRAIATYIVKNIVDSLEANDLINIKHAATNYILIFIGFSIVYQIRFHLQRVYILPKIYNKVTLLSFKILLKQNYSYYQNHLSGDLGNKIRDLAESIPIFLRYLFNLIHYIFSITACLYTLFLINSKYSTIIIVCIVIFIVVIFYANKLIIYWSKQLANSRSNIIGKIVNSLLNILPIRLFHNDKKEEEYLNLYLQNNLKIESTYNNYNALLILFIDIIFIITQAFNLIFLISDKSHNIITVGDCMIILTLNYYIFNTVFYEMMLASLSEINDSYGRISQALQILQQESSIKDSKFAKELSITKGEIVFDKVCFCYPTNNNNIFIDKSVVINGGQSIGLVGFSGSGKSSFVNLILRFFEVSSGEILIDGQSIKDITQNSLHKNIGVIPQNPTLFNRSIMDNIRYGRHDASDEEVIEAAKKAKIHNFIMSLPAQYETIIDEQSSIISGGQKQRIAIARVILKDAPILIMDEATSALDTVTENEIHYLLKNFMRNKTSIIISHRLSILSNIDRILVFDKGKIVEDGAEEELINLNGLYKEFCKTK